MSNNNKKRKEDEREEEERENVDIKSTCPVFYDFMRNDVKKRRCCDLNLTPTCCCCSSASSSVCSSALTQTSANDSDTHEETSCRENKFCLFL